MKRLFAGLVIILLLSACGGAEQTPASESLKVTLPTAEQSTPTAEPAQESAQTQAGDQLPAQSEAETPAEPTATPIPPPTPTDEPSAAETSPETQEASVLPETAALTGEQAYQLTLEEARRWQADAVLIELQTSALGPLEADGTSTGWTAKFVSPSTNGMNTMIFVNGVLNTTPIPNAGSVPPIPDVDKVIFDTKKIFQLAADAGGQEYLDKGYTAAAALTRYPLDDTMPTWYVNYLDAGYSPGFTVVIEARSGEIIHALATE